MQRAPLLTVLWPSAILTLALLSFLSGRVEFTWLTLVILALSFTCELVDSSIGMGFGTTLTPLLLFFDFDPRILVPTILLSELASGFSAFYFHLRAGNVDFLHHPLHRRTSVILSACSVLGVLVGVHMALTLPREFLTRLIGVIILAAGIFILAARRGFRYGAWRIFGLGTLAAFNKSVSGGGYGPLLTSGQVLSGLGSKPSIAITSLAEGFTCLAGASLFFLRGQVVHLEVAVPVIAGALLSVPFSARIVRRVEENWLKRFIAYATILLGCLTLYRSFR